MANLLDIRRRIRSVKNTQQITKAMKMVSTAKLRRAKERVLNARPYANEIMAVLNSLVMRTEKGTHPFLEERSEHKVLVGVFTADKGLCGAFNANVIKAVQAFMTEHRGKDIKLACVGRKGRDFFRRQGAPIVAERVNLTELNYDLAKQIAGRLMEAYLDRTIDTVYLVYNEFKSVIQQRIVVERLLPIPQLHTKHESHAVDYIYEQPAVEIINSLIPRYVEVQVLRALLESSAAEHGARMTAMDAATNNATDLIDSLTLTMNRARQAGITKEIIEIVSGAAALE
ncbi:MAG: ATP synthase F1 subunit gamma [Terriglobia bacterium]